MANKSEKRRIEQAFIFIQLRFVIKYAIDFKEESTKIEKLKTVEDKIIEILDPKDNKQLICERIYYCYWFAFFY